MAFTKASASPAARLELYADGRKQLEDGFAYDRRRDPDEWAFRVEPSVQRENEAVGR